MDPEDVGVAKRWFERSLEQTVQLPGSLQAQGFGPKPSAGHEVDRVHSARDLPDAALCAVPRGGQFQDAVLAAAQTLLCRTGLVPAHRDDPRGLDRPADHAASGALPLVHDRLGGWPGGRPGRKPERAARLRSDRQSAGRRSSPHDSRRQSRADRCGRELPQCDGSHSDELERHRGTHRTPRESTRLDR